MLSEESLSELEELPELEESDDPTLSIEDKTVVGTYSEAASNASISFYSSFISDWHGHALGAEAEMSGTAYGREMQFPFPSLSSPTAQAIGIFGGIQPPAPSETNPS